VRKGRQEQSRGLQAVSYLEQKKASPGKVSKTISKAKIQTKEMGAWLKWQSTCLASLRSWVQSPVVGEGWGKDRKISCLFERTQNDIGEHKEGGYHTHTHTHTHTHHLPHYTHNFLTVTFIITSVSL
jgi:hypothetical protein